MEFEKLYKTDVSKHIEKKGKFSYLSWPYAVAEFRKACPEGTWEIKHFSSAKDGFSGMPYCITKAGCFVEVTVFPNNLGIDGRNKQGFTQVHPVLDNRNKTIDTPNAFQINTSIQRCLVKAIALATGIGLHIYAGEDLPENDSGTPKPSTKGKDRQPKPLQFYINSMQATGNKKTLTEWWNNNNIDAKADLSTQEYDKLKILTGNHADSFDNGYQCPIPGSAITDIETCNGDKCPELSTCKPYQQALASSLGAGT